MLKIGINGFGRIGRAIFRINLNKKYFDVVAINDINNDNENLAYMLKYDSTYGRLDVNAGSYDSGITFNGKNIPTFNEKNIDDVPWGELKVDVVIDSSGVAENLLKAKNLAEKGIKCIVTNSPADDNIDKTIIMGVNEEELIKEDMIISSSICDATAFSAVMKVLEKYFGIEHGFLTTLHPWLSYQNLLDGPSKSYAYPGKVHHHYVLGRASPSNLIPKPTSCISASCKVLKFLEGKFLSLSYRVPTNIVSSADVSIKLKKPTSVKEIIDIFKEEGAKQKYKIYKNNFEPLVSMDFVGSEYSVIIDHRWTMINDSNYVKLVLWYDNEWGYSSRVVDLVKYLEKLD